MSGEETAPNGADKTNAPRKIWPKVVGFAAGAVTLIGTVATIIGIIPDLTRDPTNFGHLEVSASPAESVAAEWAVPVDILDAELSDGACGSETQAWLQDNAVPLDRSISVDMRNSAKEGSMLALVDFRARSDVQADRGPLKIRLVCSQSGVPPTNVFYGALWADDPTKPTVVTQLELGSEPGSAPSVPVAFNLGPGESGTMTFDLFSRNPSSGSIQATVLSGDEEQTVEFPGSEFELPALLFGGEMYLFTSEDGLNCFRVVERTLAECTLDHLRSEVEAAQ